MDKDAIRAQAAARHYIQPQYDLASFARRHGLSASKAKEILDRAEGSRERADLLAQRSKAPDSRTF